MRNALIVVLLCAAPAAADKPKPIDVKPVVDKLEVYKDNLGIYYIVPKAGAFESSDDEQKWLFVGDGKSMYRLRVIGSGSQGDQREWNTWAPRVTEMSTATLHVEPNKSYAQCKAKSEDNRVLTLLGPDQAKTVLKRVKLYPWLHDRHAHYLARDDDGVYYYVDALIDELGGKGFRVFVGPKGAMKQQSMTNVVSDSAGEIFATKTGQLKIITDREGKAAFWVKGGKKKELTVLPLFENRYVIYRDLGIYGPLGTLCDDQ